MKEIYESSIKRMHESVTEIESLRKLQDTAQANFNIISRLNGKYIDPSIKEEHDTQMQRINMVIGGFTFVVTSGLSAFEKLIKEDPQSQTLKAEGQKIVGYAKKEFVVRRELQRFLPILDHVPKSDAIEIFDLIEKDRAKYKDFAYFEPHELCHVIQDLTIAKDIMSKNTPLRDEMVLYMKPEQLEKVFGTKMSTDIVLKQSRASDRMVEKFAAIYNNSNHALKKNGYERFANALNNMTDLNRETVLHKVFDDGRNEEAIKDFVNNLPLEKAVQFIKDIPEELRADYLASCKKEDRNKIIDELEPKLMVQILNDGAETAVSKIIDE